MRLPSGEFIEVHAPISDTEKAVILGRPERRPIPLPPKSDENGVATPRYRLRWVQAKWSGFWHGDAVETPSAEEIEAAEQHLLHGAEADHTHHGSFEISHHGFGSSETVETLSERTPDDD